MNEMVTLLDKIKPIETDSNYTYNGIVVPRVTKIISKCIHSDSLMYWANSLGFKHQSYKKTLEEAANIGSHTHDNIDNFLSNENYEAEESSMPHQSYNAYQSFLKWFYTVSSIANVKVIFHEKTLTCKYFGGTLDGLYEINGKIYLVDYKTSKHITFKYILQLAAYRYILERYHNIKIDGVGILLLNKFKIKTEEYILDLSIQQNEDFMRQCEQTFLSLVYAYYNRLYTEELYKNIF